MSFNMGIWWIDAKMAPPTEQIWRVELAGDPNAWSQGRLPLWRWQWRWHLFGVDTTCCPQDESEGYYVYFHASGKTMRTLQWVETPNFFARLGPGDVTFWVANQGRNHYQPLPIEHLGDGGEKKRWTVGNVKDASRRVVCNWGNAVSL